MNIFMVLAVAQSIGGEPPQVIIKTSVGEDNCATRHSVQAKLGPASRGPPHQ